jgi:hypothetical protein
MSEDFDKPPDTPPTEEGGIFFEPEGWEITGDWHIVTVDTNVDLFAGLDGGLNLSTAGSYEGGTMKTTVECGNYSEIIFEHCVKNGYDGDNLPNALIYYVDGLEKLRIPGPSPWQRIIPMGLTPGKHELTFTYEYEGEPNTKAGIVDTIRVWQARPVPCLITEYTPPRPARNVGSSKVLRGFTRYQEMSVADTEINFTALFNGLDYHEFMMKSDEPFYFLDEFGVCYRGIFPDTINPKSIALDAVYSIELTMIAGQKTGFGFC